jgi:hypothetical protein
VDQKSRHISDSQRFSYLKESISVAVELVPLVCRQMMWDVAFALVMASPTNVISTTYSQE